MFVFCLFVSNFPMLLLSCERAGGGGGGGERKTGMYKIQDVHGSTRKT